MPAGPWLLLDILANTEHHVRRVVVASSRAVYGEGKYLTKEFWTRLSEASVRRGHEQERFRGQVSRLQVSIDADRDG